MVDVDVVIHGFVFDDVGVIDVGVDVVIVCGMFVIVIVDVIVFWGV